MGNGDLQDRAIYGHAVNLLHRRDGIVKVLQNVMRDNLVESVVVEGPRALIQVVDDVRVGGAPKIDVDCPRHVFQTAAKVQDFWRSAPGRGNGCGGFRCFNRKGRQERLIKRRGRNSLHAGAAYDRRRASVT